MKAKEYLKKTGCPVSLKYVAEKMWEGRKSPLSYLSRKLNETDGRSWTEKDEAGAIAILKELGVELQNL